MDRFRFLKAIASSTRSCNRFPTKSFSSAPNNSLETPWFVDEDFASRAQPPHLASASEGAEGPSLSLSADIPDHLRQLHSELSKSPHLEPWGVEIRPPLITQPGPPLPHQLPKGRRRRGRTDFGLGVPEPEGGLWRWIVLAQVKEGTENRGAIESVMRIVRKSLLSNDPPVQLPPNKKRRVQDGWGVLDAGDFAVHVLSRSARQKFFPVDARARSWHW